MQFNVDAAMSYPRLYETVPCCEPSLTLPYQNAPHHTTAASPVLGCICMIYIYIYFWFISINCVCTNYSIQIYTCSFFSSTSVHTLHLLTNFRNARYVSVPTKIGANTPRWTRTLGECQQCIGWPWRKKCMEFYLEDHPRTDGYVVNNHGDRVRPLRIGLFQFQMA